MSGRPGERRGNHDRWLVSYADLVTLLLAFFTTMYAASSMDTAKLRPIATSLQDAFAGPDGGRAAPDGTPALIAPVQVVPKKPTSNLDQLQQQLTGALEEDLSLKRVEIARDVRGLVISLPERAAFALGSADVTDEARDVIGRVAMAIAGQPNGLRVEGHTDDSPIRTPKYDNNWELSTARAAAVVAYLVKQDRIEPARLSAAGYGEFHPKMPNDSAAHRARNRRIDLVILDAVLPPDPVLEP